MHTYMDYDGNEWTAIVDPRSVRKDGKVTLGNFCVMCPMPSFRGGIPIVKKTAKLTAHTAKEA